MTEKPKAPKKTPDDLTKTTKKDEIELKEEDLGRVAGGAVNNTYKIKDE